MPEDAPKSAPHPSTVQETLALAAKKNSKQAKSSAKIMHVKVYAPFKTYYDGDALSISAINDTGPFDILPRHHNFMTLVNKCDVIIRTEDGDELRVPINRGVMHVKADRVDVFLDV